MTKVTVKTLAVIDRKPIGSVIDIMGKDFERFSKIGYVEKVEQTKSASGSKGNTTTKRKNSKSKEIDEKPEEETESK
ncbi:hypothetical protein [Staphylococcus equorum]|uniref:hypothetical protein n=1 Tax=Staphylococcus equorum TaxID=246432 RepID=UPI00192D1BD6|nr:hypothetical protein [Staphylococcus equorum]